MGRVLGKTLVLGDPWQRCDRCGQTFRASKLKLEWTGLKVCRFDWEKRHPQDFVRGHRDDQAIYNARPVETVASTNFVDSEFTPVLVSVVPGVTENVIAWEPVTDATDYKLYFDHLEMIDGFGDFILTGNVITYTHTGLETGRIYYYRIKAVMATKDTPLSNELSGRSL